MRTQVQDVTVPSFDPADARTWLAAMLSHHPSAQLADTAETRSLPRFQRDAAVRLLTILERYRGAILADDVGTGKTHVAAAVVRSLVPRFAPVLVLANVSVIPHWRRCLGSLENQVRYASFQMLSLGRLGDDYHPKLIVVDEAHHVRNAEILAYRNLCRLSVQARMLLITATPIQNSELDLSNLLDLFLPPSMNVDPWDFRQLRALLKRVMVRRTHWTLSRLYHRVEQHFFDLAGAFPSEDQSVIAIPSSRDLAALAGEMHWLLRMALPPAENALLGRLLETLLYKRLESSPAAYMATLKRWRNYLLRLDEACRSGRHLDRSRFRALFGNDPDAQVAQQVFPFFFDEAPTAPSSRQGVDPSAAFSLAGAMKALDDAMKWTNKLAPDKDIKLMTLKKLLSDRVTPTVVMTCYQDTAWYLYRQLDREGLLLLTGERAQSPRFGRMTRGEALKQFSPRSQGQGPADPDRMIRTLVATDVISEGVNLQDARRLVHYDRPFNPMAVKQRVGRISRLASFHDKVHIVTFAVPGYLETHIGLEHRLDDKLSLRSLLLGGASNHHRQFEDGQPRAAERHPFDSLEGSPANSQPHETPLDDVDRIGVDVDGFWMACAAMIGPVGSSQVRRASASVGMSGWIAAFEHDGGLHFEGMTSSGPLTAAQVFDVLVHLAESERLPALSHPAAEESQPPETWLRSVMERLHKEDRDYRFWLVEPSVHRLRIARLREVMQPQESRIYQAYQEGRIAELQAAAQRIEQLEELPAGALSAVVDGFTGEEPEDESDLFSQPPFGSDQMEIEGLECTAASGHLDLVGTRSFREQELPPGDLMAAAAETRYPRVLGWLELG